MDYIQIVRILIARQDKSKEADLLRLLLVEGNWPINITTSGGGGNRSTWR